jgi:hypothetical protein
MFGTMLASVGILLFISGLIAAARHRPEAAHARLVLGFRPKAIAQAASGRQVRIDGVISASEEACLVAPCSGAPVVWFRVRLRQLLASGGGGEGGGGNIWGTILDEQDAIPFYVDDGSGEHALVDSTVAHASADARVFETLSPDALERLRNFWIARGHAWFDAAHPAGYSSLTAETAGADPAYVISPSRAFGKYGVGKELFEEECLHPGESVAVVGLPQRASGVPTRRRYRDAHSSEWVMRAAPGQQVIVAKPEVLRRALRGTYLMGRIAMALGFLAIVAGVIAHQIAPE